MKSSSAFRYFFKGAPLFQILVGIAVTISIFVIFLSHSFELSQSWSILEPIISGFTLIAAVFIWYNEKKQEWRENLPKKMDVDYILDGERFWSVRFAPLTSEQDIRAWGQSIAKTILNEKNNIDFKGFEIISSETTKDLDDRFIQLYKVRFYLIRPIEGLEAGSILKFDSSGIAQLDSQHEQI